MGERAKKLVDEKLAQESASRAGDYWSKKSKHSALFDKLWAKLVPSSGAADTNHGEVLRNLNRMYYDLYNNGFSNGPFDEEWNNILKYKREIMKRMEDPAAFEDFASAYRELSSAYDQGHDPDDYLSPADDASDLGDDFDGSNVLLFDLEDIDKWPGTRVIDAVMDGVVVWAAEIEGIK